MIRRFVLIGLFGCLLISSNGSVLLADEDPVVARLGDTVIRQSEFKKYIEEVQLRNKDALATKQEREAYLGQIIEQRLMAVAARQKGIDKDPEVQQIITYTIDSILARQFYLQLREAISPTPDDMQNYYDSHPELFQEPEQIHVKHILVGSREAAERAMADLDTGRSFESVAHEMNKDASKERGGDIGWFQRGRLVPEFETAAFALKKGELSDIVQTRFGYHIIMLEDRRASKLLPYEQVKAQVREQVIQAMVDEQRKAIVGRLSQEKEVKVYPEAMP